MKTKKPYLLAAGLLFASVLSASAVDPAPSGGAGAPVSGGRGNADSKVSREADKKDQANAGKAVDSPVTSGGRGNTEASKAADSPSSEKPNAAAAAGSKKDAETSPGSVSAEEKRLQKNGTTAEPSAPNPTPER